MITCHAMRTSLKHRFNETMRWKLNYAFADAKSSLLLFAYSARCLFSGFKTILSDQFIMATMLTVMRNELNISSWPQYSPVIGQNCVNIGSYWSSQLNRLHMVHTYTIFNTVWNFLSWTLIACSLALSVQNFVFFLHVWSDLIDSETRRILNARKLFLEFKI